MKTLGNLFGVLILMALLSNCAALGTKTLYKAEDPIYFENPGIVGLTPDSKISHVYDKTYEVYRSTLVNEFKSRGFNKVEFAGNIIGFNFESPSKKIISTICENNNWDVILFSKMTFISTQYSVYSIPVDHNWDTEVHMKLFSNEGELLVSTKHNTYKGNTYLTTPKTKTTVIDGTKGALKRIFKEVNTSR